MSAVDALLDMVDDQPSAASSSKQVDAFLDMIDERRFSIGSKSWRPRSPSVDSVTLKKIRRKQEEVEEKLRREQEEVEEAEEEDEGSVDEEEGAEKERAVERV